MRFVENYHHSVISGAEWLSLIDDIGTFIALGKKLIKRIWRAAVLCFNLGINYFK
jgi:hypothetical protein